MDEREVSIHLDIEKLLIQGVQGINIASTVLLEFSGFQGIRI